MKYTKAIQNGKLKATAMQVGESVTGVLKDFKTNTYGKDNIIIEVQGKDVEVFVAGNLNFLSRDVADGKKHLGVFTVITRVADKALKNGRTTSQFTIEQSADESADTAATSTTSEAAMTTREKLDAIKKKRASN